MLDLSWSPGLGGGKSGLTTLEDYTTGSRSSFTWTPREPGEFNPGARALIVGISAF